MAFGSATVVIMRATVCPMRMVLQREMRAWQLGATIFAAFRLPARRATRADPVVALRAE